MSDKGQVFRYQGDLVAKLNTLSQAEQDALLAELKAKAEQEQTDE
jgi:hypothetical protein